MLVVHVGQSIQVRVEKVGVGPKGEVFTDQASRKDINHPELVHALDYVRKKMRNWEGASPELLAYIDQEIPALTPLAGAYQPRHTPEQVAKAKAETERFEDLNIPGVYVYSMPVLLDHPMNQRGDVLLKIGCGERCFEQFTRQSVATAAAQRMVLQRVYGTDDANAAALERKFHRLLDAAGHDRSDGGREWFVTSLEFLDEIANALEIPIRFTAQEEQQ